MTEQSNATNSTAQPTRPRIIIHVGKGLDRFLRDRDEASAKSNLSKLMTNVQIDVFKRDVKEFRYEHLVLPEAYAEESRAATNIMAKYREALVQPNQVLSVATMSQNVLQAVLAAFWHIRHHRQVLVCCHAEVPKASYTLSWMDNEGFLENWSYGALDADVCESELRTMKFPAAS